MAWRIKDNETVVRLGDDGVSSGPIVWVPTTDITFHRAQFPTQSRNVWRQTAPFVLEEAIIGYVEEYHFALSNEADADGNVIIAVVTKDLMDEWSALLADENIKAVTVLPDIYAVPYDGQCVLWHEGDQCWVRTGQAEGMSGSVQWICDLVQAFDFGDDLKVYSDSPKDLPEALSKKAETLPSSLEELMLQASGSSSDSLNLLQDDYAPESVIKAWLSPWKRAALAASLFLAAYLGHIALESGRLEQQTGLLKQEAGVLLTRIGLPRQAGTNIRQQVQSYVEKMRSVEQRQSAGIWSLVLGVEPLLSGCKPCIVESIDYDNEQMFLVVSNAPDLRRFEEGLQGLPAVRYERNNLSADEGRQRARFRIRKGGSGGGA